MIQGERLAVRYGDRPVLQGVDIRFEAGLIHSILGPNGCGKSTLLKALSRQLRTSGGAVYIDGQPADTWKPKPFARHLTMLAQAQEETPDIRVYDLVSYGRFAHQGVMRQASGGDGEIIAWAMQLTGTAGLADRRVPQLSGGERQRVRLAMAVAQQPSVLLLDEPTTYLDICHQLEVMELVAHLNRSLRMTVIMVLHDLNHAAAYSDRIAVMKAGALYAHGAPEDVMTETMMRDVFQVEAVIERQVCGSGGSRPWIASMRLPER